jgi:hypothetical protein
MDPKAANGSPVFAAKRAKLTYDGIHKASIAGGTVSLLTQTSNQNAVDPVMQTPPRAHANLRRSPDLNYDVSSDDELAQVDLG